EGGLWAPLSAEKSMGRRDEMLLPVGRAAGALMNLLVKEGEARRILEVGSSYGYSTTWLPEAARAGRGRGVALAQAPRAVGGRVVWLELQAAKTEYAREQLARAGLAQYVEFRVGDALAS